MLRPEDRPLFGALILLVAVVLLSALVKPFDTPPNGCEQQYANSEAFKDCVEIASAQSVAVYTRLLAYFTAALAVLTLGLAGAGVWQGRMMRKSINLARADFEATHRPWVATTRIAIRSNFVWATDRAVVGIEFCFENIGNSPAQRVYLEAEMFAFLRPEQIRAEIEKLKAAQQRRDTEDLLEFTLFPNQEPLVIPKTVKFKRSQIVELRDHRGEPQSEFVPIILGVVEYYFPFGDRRPHYTPFVRYLYRVSESGIARLPVKIDENVPINLLTLTAFVNAGDPT
jgi:hypothetical protein